MEVDVDVDVGEDEAAGQRSAKRPARRQLRWLAGWRRLAHASCLGAAPRECSGHGVHGARGRRGGWALGWGGGTHGLAMMELAEMTDGSLGN